MGDFLSMEAGLGRNCRLSFLVFDAARTGAPPNAVDVG